MFWCLLEESVDMENLYLNMVFLHEKGNSLLEGRKRAQSSEPQKAHPTSELILVS